MILVLASGGLAACVTRPLELRPAPGHLSVAGASGIYLTADDFSGGRLADAIRCESASAPIVADAFGRTRDVAMPGSAIARRKAEVFGFHACDGTDVRFVGGATYRVVSAPPLFLYQHQYRVAAGKSGSRLVADHFFSITAADSVRPLTLDALKRAYPDNHRFHDLLDLAFRTDAELMRYDEFHHEYRVARLLRQSFAEAAERSQPIAY